MTTLTFNPYDLLPGWSHYIQQEPTPKQLAFLMLWQREALFGGAAGGGKSSALLMAALMYVDVPQYSAILFRQTLTDLQQPEGLLTRAMEWLSPFPEIRYVPSLHAFIFPSGARITFGYMGSYTAWEHYQGAAYQFIGWDELTQFPPEYYKEMLSRLRRTQCPHHGGRIVEGKPAPLPDDPSCENCLLYGPLSRVPLRVRATSNPGGRGHYWIKKRWKIHRDKSTGAWVSGIPLERPFISSLHTDNPYLDIATYGKNLDELDEARRAQLKEGDWDKVASGLYDRDNFREYIYAGGYYVLLEPATRQRTESFHESALRVYLIVDVAMSVRTGTADKSYYKDRQPSWSVIGAFGVTPSGKMLVLDIVRFQQESPYLFTKLREMVKKWRPLYVGMDSTGAGKAIAQLAYADGIPVKEIPTVFDKITNSGTAQLLVKRGTVYLPANQSPLDHSPHAPFGTEWIDDFVGELMVWTGHPHDTDDQVDVLSNAAIEFVSLGGTLQRERLLGTHQAQVPTIQKHHSQLLFRQDAEGPPGGLEYPSHSPLPYW